MQTKIGFLVLMIGLLFAGLGPPTANAQSDQTYSGDLVSDTGDEAMTGTVLHVEAFDNTTYMIVQLDQPEFHAACPGENGPQRPATNLIIIEIPGDTPIIEKPDIPIFDVYDLTASSHHYQQPEFVTPGPKERP